MKRPKTPQAKKILRYAFDRRNSWGESRQTAIQTIARHKARRNRAARRKVEQTLSSVPSHPTADPTDAELAARAVRRSQWRKKPDQPLAEAIVCSRRGIFAVDGGRPVSPLREAATLLNRRRDTPYQRRKRGYRGPNK